MSTTLHATATIELEGEISNLKWDFLNKYFDGENRCQSMTMDKDYIEDLIEMRKGFDEDYMLKAIDQLIEGINKYGKIDIEIY